MEEELRSFVRTIPISSNYIDHSPMPSCHTGGDWCLQTAGAFFAKPCLTSNMAQNAYSTRMPEDSCDL